MLSISNVSKSFTKRQKGTRLALDRVSLDLRGGECHGLLGSNGAGKSTLVRIATSLVRPSTGVVIIDGHKLRRRDAAEFGVVFGNKSQLWRELPVGKSIDFIARLHPPADGEIRQDLLDSLGVHDFWEQRAASLSLGQRVRADIAAALIHGPRVLLLDEPTIGVDLQTKARIRDYLRRYVESTGAAALVTSHDPEDIETLCDSVTELRSGSVRYQGPLAGFVAERINMRSIFVIATSAIEHSVHAQFHRSGIRSRSETPGLLHLEFSDEPGKLAAALRITSQIPGIRDVSISRADLRTALEGSPG